MTKPAAKLRRTLANQAKRVAYSPTVRNLARTAITSEKAEPLRRKLADRGLEGHVRRFTSECLPEGMYFAKLTIDNWQEFNGQSFQLLQGSSVVYGNEIEPPPKGFPLEYRNIIVTSTDVSKFRLSIDSSFSLQIGHGAFTTPQQVSYDKQYGVEQHGDVFYSLRGNTTAPSKLLITFPGFGPSTSRISYAVSYLKALTDADLSDTLMVCFQDRYLAAGSYMLVDNGGRSLIQRVNDVIAEFVDRYGIAEDQMLFFGASKGGSIAIQYAENFPAARLLVAVPQMNLRYYLDKPFFKDNIFAQEGMHSVPQPERLIRTYFTEGRTIDYFYTNTDEQSNHSLIELVEDIPGLSKYRVDGQHGEVARKALPTMLSIMRRFLSDRTGSSTTSVDEVHCFDHEGARAVQVRVDPDRTPESAANWYLEGSLGRTRFLQFLSDHDLPFVKYTNEQQRLHPEIDDLRGLHSVVAYDESGGEWVAPLPQTDELTENAPPRHKYSTDTLRLDAEGAAEYVIVRDSIVNRFSYDCRRGTGNEEKIDVHIVPDINAFDLAEVRHRTDARFVAAVEALATDELIDLMVNRLFLVSVCESMSVIVHDHALSESAEQALTGYSATRASVALDKPAEATTSVFTLLDLDPAEALTQRV
ncbi:hypothetical protein DFO66_11247 [Brevibacterium sanguinis]|uniref:Uncharacterized protein n=2 Tax=Brevibacterium TaxID=1696 RepID=A0A366IGV0_9MICO|nr:MULTISPECIES: hypothetical protein [Brevibacterium]RBP62943.1 hypothetical protein DFO66_11247 [Brevibacterium sanguinis]RBP69512.1 hypothetical protein DFO65_11246 [Brevibacterium celere]